MSENVEMYLVSIARIAEASHDETVPIPSLAEKLDILPVSANQMIRKLEETGLVRYLPYKGVQLTEDGRLIADQVRRHHQLWETFLVRYLKFPLQTADALACRFEHIMSEDEVERLAAFLEDPSDILSKQGLSPLQDAPDLHRDIPLADLSVGQSGHVTKGIADQALASFLFAAGLQPGVRLKVLATADSGDILVQVGEGGRLHLASDLAIQIWLRKAEN